jgi:hypothetical protein
MRPAAYYVSQVTGKQSHADRNERPSARDTRSYLFGHVSAVSLGLFAVSAAMSIALVARDSLADLLEAETRQVSAHALERFADLGRPRFSPSAVGHLCFRAI